MKRLVKKAISSPYDGRLEKIRQDVIGALRKEAEDFDIFEITEVDWVRNSEFEIEDYFEILNTEEELDKVRITYTLDEYENENFEIAFGYGYNDYIDLKDSNSIVSKVISILIYGEI